MFECLWWNRLKAARPTLDSSTGIVPTSIGAAVGAAK